jgi:hypothetical protein
LESTSFGLPNYVWESKLHLVIQTLKIWAKTFYVSPFQERFNRIQELENIQQTMEEREVTENALQIEREAYQNVHVAFQKEE